MGFMWTFILGIIAFFLIRRHYARKQDHRLSRPDTLFRHRDREIERIKRLTDRRY